MTSLKEKTARGLLWSGAGNLLTQLFGALFGVVLLRLLTPADYGMIACLQVFALVATNLQESGFIVALINRREPTDRDYNAVFWFNITVSTALYLALWFAAPYIARFYHEPRLVPLARYLFLGFLLSSLGTVQRAYIYGHILAKQQSLITLGALIVSNTVGVVMALLGFAFWGLATQSVLYIFLVMVADWWVSPWRPSLKIDLRPAWEMFGFSSKMLATNLLVQLNAQVFSFLLGRFYTPHVVGIYSNARKWTDMGANTLNGMINAQVSQPVLAQAGADSGRQREVFRKLLRFTSFVSLPSMLGLGLVAPEFIAVVIGPRWAESAPLMQWLCVYGAIYPIQILFNNLFLARGRSGTLMAMTAALCVLIWGGMIALTPFGIRWMVIYFVALNILFLLSWLPMARRLIGLRLRDAARDIFPFLLVALLALAAGWGAALPFEAPLLTLAVKVCVAVAVYLIIIWASGAKIMRESLAYLKHKG